MKNPTWLIIFVAVVLGVFLGLAAARTAKPRVGPKKAISKIAITTINPELENGVEKNLVPTKKPTPTPISFEDLNKNFGPCVKLPVLMYHHIEEEVDAKKKGQTGLNVTPEFFRKQMEYLKTKGYEPIFLDSLANFFNNGTLMPKKAVAITLDDAYEDNFRLMYPILKEYGFKATIFTPTGLVQNPDYLSWNNIKEMSASGLVYFANHTWSHHPSSGSVAVQEKEIGLADTQLRENGQNPNKIFAYPYGNPGKDAEIVLVKDNYNMAFTTRHGNIMCKGQKFELPRIRIGNAPLSSYGL